MGGIDSVISTVQKNAAKAKGLRRRASEERLRVAETASGFGTFEMDLISGKWDWSPQVAILFGLDPQKAAQPFSSWEKVAFIDDIPKIREALKAAPQKGDFYVEFRVKHADGSLHWIAGKGLVSEEPGAETLVSKLRGAFYEITERKALEIRLLALNETLEARVAQFGRKPHPGSAKPDRHRGGC